MIAPVVERPSSLRSTADDSGFCVTPPLRRLESFLPVLPWAC